ncbi:hypothetical protein DL96DRAFT_1812096 [Flagelloscypha sp. PMI_526]|nr:hypothetical protein DL96DRAFT_1812096 [Flagelloscypha sp. PMI_526]
MPAECSVCLDPFNDASHRPTALTCGHVHCFACTTTWFKSHATCPTCNHKFSSPVPIIRLFLPMDKSHEQFVELTRRVEKLEEEKRSARDTINTLLTQVYRHPTTVTNWIDVKRRGDAEPAQDSQSLSPPSTPSQLKPLTPVHAGRSPWKFNFATSSSLTNEPGQSSGPPTPISPSVSTSSTCSSPSTTNPPTLVHPFGATPPKELSEFAFTFKELATPLNMPAFALGAKIPTAPPRRRTASTPNRRRRLPALLTKKPVEPTTSSSENGKGPASQTPFWIEIDLLSPKFLTLMAVVVGTIVRWPTWMERAGYMACPSHWLLQSAGPTCNFCYRICHLYGRYDEDCIPCMIADGLRASRSSVF